MTTDLLNQIALIDGAAGPPRDNGEVVFDAPWEARAFALAIAVVQRLDLPWDAFRLRLIDQITDAPDRPYYESWTLALELLILNLGLTTPDALDARTPAERAPLCL
jgi:nitrile hydratase accessory protein